MCGSLISAVCCLAISLASLTRPSRSAGSSRTRLASIHIPPGTMAILMGLLRFELGLVCIQRDAWAEKSKCAPSGAASDADGREKSCAKALVMHAKKAVVILIFAAFSSSIAVRASSRSNASC